MPVRPIDTILVDEQTAVTTELQSVVRSSSSEDRLRLTGIEVLGFIAVKVVIPIACGFVSRLLYEKYKDIQTGSQAERARKELLTADAGEVMNEQAMKVELVEMLTKEGLGRDKAERLIDNSVTRMKGRLLNR
jgi:hypothetical protein